MLPHTSQLLSLDSEYNIDENSWFIILQPGLDPIVTRNIGVNQNSIAAYGITGKTTQLSLGDDSAWLNGDNSFATIRESEIFAQPEELELAEEPIETTICGGSDNLIELDGFYEDLDSGRWVIVSGERELNGTTGVRFSELAMISSISQGVPLESPDSRSIKRDERFHTYIKFAEKLAYCFKRDTVTINGNVVKATHGETRHEILGSGNGAQNFQSFTLKQLPLTYTSSSNPSGIKSSLKLLVNDLEWHESDSLVELEANDRGFTSKTDNESNTSVIFGNGENGGRLPSGFENIKAEYRNGIGKEGNVKAEQISLLSSKPLGVKSVLNPLRASGGANKETRDQARKHVPLAVKALDRLVSVQDYQDFSRIYAGIGKARAVELSDGRQQIVHVTIAGAEDIPIDENSDLFRNLRKALHDFGDTQQVVKLAVRELKYAVIEAGVAIMPDYQWESVEYKLREKLLEIFSFEKRELGQDIMQSEVIKVMQSVPGVAYVDVNAFGGIPEKISATEGEKEALELSRRLLTPDEISNEVTKALFVSNGDDGFTAVRRPVPQRLNVNLASFNKTQINNKHIQPAQIAFISPEIPSTLILNQIESTS